MRIPQSRYVVILMALGGLAGCQHIGPGTILEDRLPYNDAVSTSWKEQTLLNIVRLRYDDVPEFIEVSAINSAYALDRTTTGNFSTTVHPQQSIMNILTFGLGGTLFKSDRPIITYAPQVSSQFTHNLTNPIPPSSLLNLTEGGPNVEAVFDLAVESINGVRNKQFRSGQVRQKDPKFEQLVGAMKNAHSAGHLSVRHAPDGDKKNPELVITLWDQTTRIEEIDKIRNLLSLTHDPKIHDFKIVFQMLPRANDEIAFRTRSVFRVMTYLSLGVQVPESHLADGRAAHVEDADSDPNPHFTVHSGCKKPCDSYVAVHYQGYWFWIEPSDLRSKRSMYYLRILLALADPGTREAGPVLTLRAH